MPVPIPLNIAPNTGDRSGPQGPPGLSGTNVISGISIS